VLCVCVCGGGGVNFHGLFSRVLELPLSLVTKLPRTHKANQAKTSKEGAGHIKNKRLPLFRRLVFFTSPSFSFTFFVFVYGLFFWVPPATRAPARSPSAFTKLPGRTGSVLAATLRGATGTGTRNAAPVACAAAALPTLLQALLAAKPPPPRRINAQLRSAITPVGGTSPASQCAQMHSASLPSCTRTPPILYDPGGPHFLHGGVGCVGWP
jgi:hypothetical protein